jgi:hypothetical protein
MPRFVDRQRELRELNGLLERSGAQFVTVPSNLTRRCLHTCRLPGTIS